jgi:hypothetical protein
MRSSVEETGLTATLRGGPAGRCGSVLTVSSGLGPLSPAGPSAITRNTYFVAGFRSSITAVCCSGEPVSSICCHVPVSHSCFVLHVCYLT